MKIGKERIVKRKENGFNSMKMPKFNLRIEQKRKGMSQLVKCNEN